MAVASLEAAQLLHVGQASASPRDEYSMTLMRLTKSSVLSAERSGRAARRQHVIRPRDVVAHHFRRAGPEEHRPRS